MIHQLMRIAMHHHSEALRIILLLSGMPMRLKLSYEFL